LIRVYALAAALLAHAVAVALRDGVYLGVGHAVHSGASQKAAAKANAVAACSAEYTGLRSTAFRPNVAITATSKEGDFATVA
jgi:hypothetical protein